MRLRVAPIPAQIRKVKQWLGQRPPWMPRGCDPNFAIGPLQSYAKRPVVSYRVCLGDQSGATTAQDFCGKRPVHRALEPHRLAIEFRYGGLRRREAAFYAM